MKVTGSDLEDENTFIHITLIRQIYANHVFTIMLHQHFHLILGNWSFANHALSIPKGCFDLEDEKYGNTGYGVSSLEMQN